MPVLQAMLADLDALHARGAVLAAHLSADERARAARLAQPRDRARFVARHGWLREQLAVRLGTAPAALRFGSGRFGKPFLHGATLGFNLSCARHLALLVVGEGAEIGCDIAWRDPDIDAAGIVAQFFSPQERQAMAALPPASRLDGFFHAWACKEAFAKALGCGLSRPLGSFSVAVDPAQPAALLDGCDGWSVASFLPRPGFHAAVVAAGAWRLAVAA